MHTITKYFFKNKITLFTTADVFTVIQGSKDRIYGQLKRLIKSGEIINIRRGLYCLAPEYYAEKPNVFYISERIYKVSYISLESALSYHDWIPEAVYTCTAVCSAKSKEFTTPLGVFSYQRIPQDTLFCGVTRITTSHKDTFFMATPEKALCDYIYTNKLDWKNTTQAADYLRIDTDNILSAKPETLNKLSNNYKSKRIKSFLKSWLKEIT